MYFWTGIWKYYCHVSNQHPQICLVAKFGSKIKILKFPTKNVLFEYFCTGTWENCYHVWNQHIRVCLIAKYHEIMKMPKFATKSALIGYFWARILKTIVIFEISTFKFVYFQNFTKKQKWLILGPQMPDSCIVRLKFESNIVIFEISTLKFV